MTMHDDDIMRELLKTFNDEAVEHLQTLNQSILKMERSSDPEEIRTILQEAFRAAHSLKGAARTVSLDDIEQLSHSLEDVLKMARDQKLELTPAVCDRIYNVLDGVQQCLNGETVAVNTLVEGLMSSLPAEEEPGQTVVTEEAPLVPEAVSASVPVEVVEVAEVVQPTVPKEPRAIQAESAGSDETIRVAISKLDAMMAQAGELIATRISAEQRAAEMQLLRRQFSRLPRLWREIKMLTAKNSQHENDDLRRLLELIEGYHATVQEISEDVSVLDTAISRDALRLGMVSRQLQDEMRRVRMVPFSSLEPIMQRTVRDVARIEEKDVTLTIEGGEIELDKKVLELLRDALLHLLRNSVGHGIESPQMRLAAGKSPVGHLRVTISQRGSEASVTVADDGQGFQIEKLREVANNHQYVSNGEDNELIALAFQPGITTTQRVTTIAGRGVGLDVVRQQVEDLQGRIDVDNRPGQGVAIQLIVPVSLAMTRVLLVRVGQYRYAIPLTSVEKIIAPEKTFSVEDQAMVVVDEKPLPLVSLADILSTSGSDEQEPIAVVLGALERRIALLVDDVLTEQELAVKAFSHPINRVHLLTGAALLGNGEPIVVLNPVDIVKSPRSISLRQFKPVAEVEEETKEPDHILVVDDSITTRTLEKNILKAAGYVVHTATDGLEALTQLRLHPIQLVVADIEMPNMDGITLTQHLRDSDEYKELPIILVTSLESTSDRERGMHAGANAYMVKRGFNQSELLNTIRQYI
jgi:two-component system chemotaxis sensor kinase CheA